MTVLTLRTLLMKCAEDLEQYPDNLQISMQSNTYFVNNARYFLGCREGYTDIENPKVEQDDDHCDECGGMIEWDEEGHHGICKKCGEEY